MRAVFLVVKEVDVFYAVVTELEKLFFFCQNALVRILFCVYFVEVTDYVSLSSRVAFLEDCRHVFVVLGRVIERSVVGVVVSTVGSLDAVVGEARNVSCDHVEANH